VLIKNKVSTLPIVNEQGDLLKIISRGDLKKNKKFDKASKDVKNRLLVGAAIGTREADKDRVQKLIQAGCDVIVIDSSNGSSTYQLEMIAFIKSLDPEVQVIAGNIVTKVLC
jgi:IMP dehydrogenase